jgi:hypothetical protein
MRRAGDSASIRRLVVGLVVIALVLAGIYIFFWSGLFRFDPEEETFWNLLHQKGHWYLEMFISGVETLLFDIVIGLVGWRYLLKPYVAKRQADAIAKDHALHGIEDHEESPGERPVTNRLRRPRPFGPGR